MYSTCLFCNGDLGRNEAIEAFPVGRRLAFDAAKGRLWVVCRRCERWNLSPLEERWEAIEACEKAFADTRVRVSTDNIGLAKLKEGLELVRVGPALRPEFAAWRYGDQFGRRRRRMYTRIGIATGVVGGVAAATVALGVSAGIGFGGGGYWMFQGIYRGWKRLAEGSPREVVAAIAVPGSAPVTLKRRDIGEVRLGQSPSEGLVLSLPLDKRRVHFTGDDARRAVALVIPAVNHAGGERTDVAQAVELIERSDAAPERFVDDAARKFGFAQPLLKLPAPVRLALEMATHEETERRAMAGELALLEAAWRSAEEIAQISDDLLVEPSTEEFLARHRRR